MRFKVRIRGVTPLCVGGGTPEPGIDIAFAKRPRLKEDGETEYEYYIPGSSLKGALRSAASRIAEAYGFEFCGEMNPERLEERHREGEPCHICRLFGFPSGDSRGSSRLFVSDLQIMDEGGSVEPFIATRVRIDDRSMRAAEGALFNLEYIPPGVEFRGEITIWRVDKELLGLLLLALAELRLDRFGRGSIIDLKIEDCVELEEAVRGSGWEGLLTDLKEWIWSEAI